MSNTRDLLRAATLGAAIHLKRRTVEIPQGTVEVLQPTVAQRRDILRGAGAKAGKTDVDPALLQARAVMALVVVPGTTEPVFEEGDLQGLLAQPCGGWFDELAEHALKMINVEKSGDALGNSEATPNGGSSSE